MISARSATTALRRAPRSARAVRFNSTATSSTSTASTMSPFVAGLAGGGAVLAGGYAYYHFSGAKDLVNSAKSMHQSIKSAKDMALQKAPAPNEVINYLRNVAKSYAALVPGASRYIDASFDAIDELHRTHKDEVEAILNKTYQEVKDAVQGGQMDIATATKVLGILKKQSAELGELAKKVGGDIIGPVLEKHPEIKEKIGGGYAEMKRLAEDAKNTEVAKQAQTLYDDTTKQLADLFSTGFSTDAITRAKSLLEEKSKQVQELSQKASKQIWKKGQNEYLDKAPEDVKKLFSDNDTVSALTSGSAAVAVTQIWSKVKDVSSSKTGFDEKNINDLKELLKSKVQEAKDKASEGGASFDAAWSAAQGWLKSIPGGQRALDAAPDIDVQALSKVATSRSDEAKKLAQETYSEVLNVFKEKADKAKQLGESTAKDAKSSQGESDDSEGDERQKGADKRFDDKQSKGQDKKSPEGKGKDGKKKED